MNSYISNVKFLIRMKQIQSRSVEPTQHQIYKLFSISWIMFFLNWAVSQCGHTIFLSQTATLLSKETQTCR